SITGEGQGRPTKAIHRMESGPSKLQPVQACLYSRVVSVRKERDEGQRCHIGVRFEWNAEGHAIPSVPAAAGASPVEQHGCAPLQALPGRFDQTATEGQSECYQAVGGGD